MILGLTSSRLKPCTDFGVCQRQGRSRTPFPSSEVPSWSPFTFIFIWISSSSGENSSFSFGWSKRRWCAHRFYPWGRHLRGSIFCRRHCPVWSYSFDISWQMRDLGVCVEIGAAAWKFVSAWKHLGFVAWAIELSTRGGRGRGWHRCFASYLPLTDLWSFLLSAFTIFRLSFQLSRHVGS